MTEEVAERRGAMDNLYGTLSTLVLVENKFSKTLDKYMPWREYRNNEAILETWDEMWENPEKFAEGELEVSDDREAQVFRMGVCFGIEYERAYPTGERDKWPVSVEER